MSNLEHELMAAERALRNIAEMTGGDYVAFHFYRGINKLGVNIHDGELVRSRTCTTLNEAVGDAIVAKPFDVVAHRKAREAAAVDEAA